VADDCAHLEALTKKSRFGVRSVQDENPASQRQWSREGEMPSRFERAIARLSTTLSRFFPRDGDDYMSRGLDRHLRGNLAGAIADYGRALEHYADHDSQVIAYVTRGNARRDKGDLQGAIDDYSQAIATHPGSAGAYLSRGLAYMEAGEQDKALADLLMVPELSPDPSWRQQALHHVKTLQAEET
jgi:tetratricopeptide (TPR) repeat protein